MPGKTWKSSQVNRYPRRADICDVNMAQGIVPDEQPFFSGHQMPPYHINCRCTLIVIFSAGFDFELEEGMGGFDPPLRRERIEHVRQRPRLDRPFERGRSFTDRARERGW